MPWQRNRRFLDAVTRASFWRSDPAAELRGFANGERPASTSDSLSFLKSSGRMKTSPRTSTRSGAASVRVSGISPIVRTLAVTSSPKRPSPRVAAVTSRRSR